MTASRKDVLVHGIVAGTIAYIFVAISFGLVDFLYGRPVYATAAFLGARITGRAASALQPFDPAAVMACTAVHLVLMLGAGFLGSLFVHSRPHGGFLPYFAFAAGVVAALVASFAFAAGLLGAVYIDLVWINLAAAAAATSYLLVGPNPATVRLSDHG